MPSMRRQLWPRPWRRATPRRLSLLAIAIASAIVLGSGLLAAGSPISGVTVRVIGNEQSVFDRSTQHCPDYTLPRVTGKDGPLVKDMPDQPARAFRTADGHVTLMASNRVALRMVGPNLNHVRRICRPALVSPYLGQDASSYAMRLWMYSPYTPDGQHVYALLHTEYHGNSNLPATDENCPSGDKQLCWYDAITMASSNTAGTEFRLTPRPPGNLVASIPYKYDRNANGAAGYFETSNIIRKDGYYYALMTAMTYQAQKRGTCLIRTKHLADPTSWRGWNGRGFAVRFIDPYRDPGADPAKHVCRPVSPDRLGVTAQGLVYSTYLKRYVAVDSGAGRDPHGNLVDGVYFATSPDLFHWTKRRLLWRQQVFNDWQPGDPNPIGYASLIDPSSHSRNFDTVGRRPYLYFVRDQWNSVNRSNRNLHRIRIEFNLPHRRSSSTR
jgi:hypothetical protein